MKMALLGFNEFMPLRKSGNIPANYKELIDYFKFAQEKFNKNEYIWDIEEIINGIK